jgi:hypothetical protein
MEEVIALLAGNFEANETEALSRNNGLLAFAAEDDCPEFHTSPPQFCLLFRVGKLVS